jgi:hypothetical protein
VVTGLRRGVGGPVSKVQTRSALRRAQNLCQENKYLRDCNAVLIAAWNLTFTTDISRTKVGNWQSVPPTTGQVLPDFDC